MATPTPVENTKKQAKIQLRPEVTDEYVPKGGVVKETGKALVHKGEQVLTKAQAKKPIIKKAVKKVSK